MKLELDDQDLKPEYQDKLPARDVTFDKLNDKAQEVVKLVGQGTYYNYPRTNHNVVYPPKS